MNKSELIIFVGDIGGDESVYIKCPDCYFRKSFPLAKLAAFKRLISIRCKCGNSFAVKLEYRAKLRKKTKLEGLYCDLSLADQDNWRAYLDDKNRNNCHIIDLSVAGLALVSKVSNFVEIGHKLRLRFELDRGVSPLIELDMTVCNIKGNTFGCEFCDKDKYSKKIGFYLL